jgi:hypothetical protein
MDDDCDVKTNNLLTETEDENCVGQVCEISICHYILSRRVGSSGLC